MFGGGPIAGLRADPQGTPRAHAPAHRGLLHAVQAPGRGRPGRDPGDEPDRPGQPAPARPPARPGDHRPGLREAEPVRRADDRAADHHGPDRRRAELPQQRHRPERHAGPARRAVRPPPGDAAPLLHRDADGRDPEPTRQRRRWRPGGRDRHGQLDHQQPGDRDLDDDRDVHPRLAAGPPVPRPHAGLPVPDLSSREGPPRGVDRDPEVAGRDERHDRGDAERLGDPAVEDVRSAADLDRQVPAAQQDAWPRSRSARRWSGAGSS